MKVSRIFFSKIDQLQSYIKIGVSLPRSLRFLIVIVFFFGLALFGAELLFAWSMKYFLTQIGILAGAKSSITSNPWLGFLIFVGFGVLRSLALSGRLYFQQVLTVKFSFLSRVKVSDYALEHGGEMNVSEVVAVYSDIVQRSAAFLNGLMSLLFNFTLALSYFSVCCYYSISASFLSLLLILILLLPLFVIGAGISTLSELIGNIWKQQSSRLIDGLRNFLFIKIHGLTIDEQTKMTELADQYQNYFRKFALIYGIRSSYTPVVGIIVLGLVGIFSSVHGVGVPETVLVVFFYMFVRFSQAAGELINSWSECELNAEAMSSLENWKKDERKIDSSKARLEDFRLSSLDQIEIKNLSFGFDPQSLLINSINLKLLKGDILYISGDSGSGKSTLLSLLLGILKPISGQILINGHPVENTNLRTSGLVTYSGPSPLLVSGSLRENLIYGNKKASEVSDLQMLETLKSLGLEMSNLDLVIDDKVGLSTGQKQRLSIARAFLMDPELLIFDEATSNLDMRSESLVYEALLKRKSNMITIVVSHRDSVREIKTQALKL